MLAALKFLQERSARFGSSAFSLRVQSERALRRAIQSGAIQPFFQPMVELPSGAPVGFEVLARWIGPHTGVAGPDAFIPLAESSGLLPLLTESLLRASCLEAMSWPEHLALAINISPRQIMDRSLPERIRRTVEPTGFPLARLEVELTEQVMAGSLSQAAGVAEDLKKMGICLVMDDYGVGASDMYRLDALPFDKIKLDCSLVRALDQSPQSRLLVRSVIELAADRGLGVVAEGIETQFQAEILRDLQCPIAQGWLFGRPVSGRDVLSALAAETEGQAHIR
jgi:EAL domain-containing protein (putative c-di-GMP-specific phosphodiesterase class I)